MQEVRCNGVNISEGGVAVNTVVPFIPGESVRIQFILPDHTVSISARSTICWSDTEHLGVRFVSISDEHKSELQGWLSRKLEETLPEFVAGQFRAAVGSSITATAVGRIPFGVRRPTTAVSERFKSTSGWF
jgi:hypothetical protein